MNLPYKLSGYKTKIDALSIQAKSILEFCVSTSDPKEFILRLNQEEKLERETIEILRKAIFAGYESTIYTYNWSNKQELDVWKVINSKCEEKHKVYFILARIKSANFSADKLKDLYFKSFEQHLDYVFSLEDEDKEQLYSNPETRYEFLKYEFRARITQWDDFEENWTEEKEYWEEKFSNDEKAIKIFQNELNKKRRTIESEDN